MATIARTQCGCVVAVDLSEDEKIAKRFVKRGYAVSVASREQAAKLLAGASWPCRHEHFRMASEEVATWPAWKRNILDNSPTLKVPREPVLNDDDSYY